MATPLINGEAYSFGQIIVNVLGVPIVGVRSISYRSEQEKTNNYAQGNNPISRGRGQKTVTGSIEIEMADILALRSAVGGDGSLLDLPFFDVVVTWANAQGPFTDVIKNVDFTTDGPESEQGTTQQTVVLDFIASHVVYGV